MATNSVKRASHQKMKSRRLRNRRKLRLKTYLRACGPHGLLHFLRELAGVHAEIALPTSEGVPPLYLRLNTPDILVYREIMQRSEYAFDLQGEIRTIVDAGANIGLAAIYFARRFPQARIVALEPERTNYEQLCKNTRGYPQITAVKAALWDRQEPIEIFARQTGSLGFSIHNTDGSETSTETVDALRVEDVMDRYGMAGIDLLKIDIEGAEKEVFTHSSGWIDHIGIIVAEMHDRISMGCSRAFYRAIDGFPIDFSLHQNLVAMREHYYHP